MLKKFVIENTFHNSTVTVLLPEEGGTLSLSQQRRVERALCGISGCRCGNMIKGENCIMDGPGGCEGGIVLWTVRPIEDYDDCYEDR